MLVLFLFRTGQGATMIIVPDGFLGQQIHDVSEAKREVESEAKREVER